MATVLTVVTLMPYQLLVGLGSLVPQLLVTIVCGGGVRLPSSLCVEGV